MNATARQISYIEKLRRDQAYRMDLPLLTREQWEEQYGTRMGTHEGYLRRREAGREAFTADLTGITAARASEIIDALKAW